MSKRRCWQCREWKAGSSYKVAQVRKNGTRARSRFCAECLKAGIDPAVGQRSRQETHRLYQQTTRKENSHATT